MKKRIWLVLLCAVWAAVMVGLAVFMFVDSQRPTPTNPATEMTEATRMSTEGGQLSATETIPPETTVPETTESQVPEETEAPEPYEFTSTTSFVYDFGSRTALLGEEILDKRIYPASITKLFTVFVALKYAEPEQVFTAGSELDMVPSDSSFAYIEKGQQLTVSMLIEGMLLPSGNDAAHILAAGVGRQVSGNQNLSGRQAVAYFMELVNAEAKAQGLTGTHFVTPDGYHDENHYTTCRDLITIARLALSNSLIRTYAGRPAEDVTYVSGQTNQWKNSNLLVQPDSEFYCPEARGLKTGSHSAAGACLLSAFLVGERYVLIGVFGSPEYYARFGDALYLYNTYVA